MGIEDIAREKAPEPFESAPASQSDVSSDPQRQQPSSTNGGSGSRSGIMLDTTNGSITIDFPDPREDREAMLILTSIVQFLVIAYLLYKLERRR